MPTDLVTAHPPPLTKGTSLSGGAPCGPLGKQSLALEITTGGGHNPQLPRPQPALCSLTARVPERFSSHTRPLSFGIGHASRKCQGPQDTLPRSTGVSVTYLGGPCMHQTGWVRPYTHIAPRRAPAHPLNKPLSLGLPCPVWAGCSGFGLVRLS